MTPVRRILYRDAAGNFFNNPAAGRTAVINTLGGGNSRNVRRPDLVAGVDPFIENGGVLFLNPGAAGKPRFGRQPSLALLELGDEPIARLIRL